MFTETDVDEQGSKVPAFFGTINGLFEEMKWQMKLKSRPDLYQITTNFSNWKALAFTFAIVLNLLVAVHYPFQETFVAGTYFRQLSFVSTASMVLSGLFMALVLGRWWNFHGFSALDRPAHAHWYVTGSLPQRILSFRIFVVALAFWMSVHGQVVVAVQTLGFLQFLNAGVMLVSYLGNRMSHYVRDSSSSSEASGVSQMLVFRDPMLSYQVGYMCICLLGLVWDVVVQAPPTQGRGCFFYSLLLIDIVFYDATLWNVIQSVTWNGKSILLTGFFMLILAYIYSIAGYMYFQVPLLHFGARPLTQPCRRTSCSPSTWTTTQRRKRSSAARR